MLGHFRVMESHEIPLAGHETGSVSIGVADVYVYKSL